jgi:flavin-dependent dehydrogenase
LIVNKQVDVLIIGGGLAGLVSAIHLSKHNIQVLLIEKNNYPKHKVCGEYISNEVLPYLEFLEINPFNLGAQKINKFLLSTPKNRTIKAVLPLGGFGISRYTLDSALANKAKEQGVIIVQDSVTDIQFINDEFIVFTKNNGLYNANIVIGAYGKRSTLDIKFKRDFIQKKAPFLAVKMHVKGEFPNDLVALHNFEGGYCGVSKVENGSINLCYIADFETFKKYKDIDDFQEKVVFKNTFLKSVFKSSSPVFEVPLTISQVSFASKNPVEQHILMCGDTAGMIHPLCGNGMSMAIRSAQIASQLIIDYKNKRIKSRELLEKAYIRDWNKEFKSRLKTGHLVASLFRMNHFSEVLIRILKIAPNLLPKIIKRTHGKPMIIK